MDPGLIEKSMYDKWDERVTCKVSMVVKTKRSCRTIEICNPEVRARTEFLWDLVRNGWETYRFIISIILTVWISYISVFFLVLLDGHTILRSSLLHSSSPSFNTVYETIWFNVLSTVTVYLNRCNQEVISEWFPQ